MKPLRLWEAKEATGPSRRRAPSWFVGTENLLQAALQGLAKSIGPPCPSLFRSVVCRLRSSLASPIMPSAPAALQGTPTPAEKPRAAEVHPDSTSADSYGGKASADSSAATGTPFKLHFCEETNEPEDVCNAQWLVVSRQTCLFVFSQAFTKAFRSLFQQRSTLSSGKWFGIAAE